MRTKILSVTVCLLSIYVNSQYLVVGIKGKPTYNNKLIKKFDILPENANSTKFNFPSDNDFVKLIMGKKGMRIVKKKDLEPNSVLYDLVKDNVYKYSVDEHTLGSKDFKEIPDTNVQKKLIDTLCRSLGTDKNNIYNHYNTYIVPYAYNELTSPNWKSITNLLVEKYGYIREGFVNKVTLKDDISKTPKASNIKTKNWNDQTKLKKASLKKYCPYPGNQGHYATCTAWASAYAARTISWAIQNNDTTQNNITNHAFSPTYLYKKIKQPIDYECLIGGTSTIAALEFMNKYGVVLKSDLDEPCININIDYLDKSATEFKIGEYTNCDTDLQDITDKHTKDSIFEKYLEFIKISITNKKPILASIVVYPSFHNSFNIDSWDGNLTSTSVGRHAICIIGFDDEKSDGEGAVEMLNSWGNEYGKDGYIWVKYKDLKNILINCLTFNEPINHRKAFVLGVGEYKGDRNKLPNSINDEDSIKKVLHEKYNFEITELKVEKTLATVNPIIEEWIEDINNEDTIIFYFSGHGIAIKDSLSENYNNYLLLEDYIGIDFNKHSICFQDIEKKIISKKPKIPIFIIDACRENVIPSKGQTNNKGIFLPEKGIFYALSSQFDKKSWAQTWKDGKEISKNSLFTHFLLEQLKTEHNKSLTNIFSTVDKNVREISENEPEYKKSNPSDYIQEVVYASVKLEEIFLSNTIDILDNGDTLIDILRETQQSNDVNIYISELLDKSIDSIINKIDIDTFIGELHKEERNFLDFYKFLIVGLDTNLSEDIQTNTSILVYEENAKDEIIPYKSICLYKNEEDTIIKEIRSDLLYEIKNEASIKDDIKDDNTFNESIENLNNISKVKYLALVKMIGNVTTDEEIPVNKYLFEFNIYDTESETKKGDFKLLISDDEKDLKLKEVFSQLLNGMD